MNAESKMAIRKVLVDAADAAHFFDLSDAERLNWMIERAYELGKAQRNARRKVRRRVLHSRPKGALSSVVKK